jgi:hypothetical protein
MGVKIILEDIEPDWSFHAVPKAKWPELLAKKSAWVMETMDTDARNLGRASVEVLETEAWKLKATSFREFVEKEWRIGWSVYESIMKGLTEIGYRDACKIQDAERLGRMLQAREAESRGALAEHGINQHAQSDGGPYLIRSSRHGTSSDYLLRRMLRDCPEYVARYERGEFPSVRAAAIAAGIVKVPSAEEKAVKAFRKAQDQQAVLRQILEELGGDEIAEFEEPAPQPRCKDEAVIKAFDRCDNRLNVLYLLMQRLEKHERATVSEWLSQGD